MSHEPQIRSTNPFARLIKTRRLRTRHQLDRGLQLRPQFRKNRFAVLPFENPSGEKVNTYFADGVQAEIRTDLRYGSENPPYCQL